MDPYTVKPVLCGCSAFVSEFHNRFTEHPKFPKTRYDNADAYSFSSVMTCIYIAEFCDYTLDAPYTSVIFYLGWIMFVRGALAVDEIVSVHLGTFSMGYIKNGTLTDNFCEEEIISLIERILKIRQASSVKDVSTSTTRAIELYQGTPMFRDNIDFNEFHRHLLSDPATNW